MTEHTTRNANAHGTPSNREPTPAELRAGLAAWRRTLDRAVAADRAAGVQLSPDEQAVIDGAYAYLDLLDRLTAKGDAA